MPASELLNVKTGLGVIVKEALKKLTQEQIVIFVIVAFVVFSAFL